MIPLFKVFMAPDVNDYILPVLHSGYVGEGERSQEFENAIGEFIQSKNVILVNSGTSALTMALKLADIGNGDYVVSTPMTCLATNMAILSVGAKIIWADILPDGTIDPYDVKKKVRTNRSVKAIVCMDWGGLPCELGQLREVGDWFGVPIIEDACQSLGARYARRMIGHDADFVAFSFQAIKTLTCVDGGALVINGNSGLLERARSMRWFGLDRSQSADMRCNQDPLVVGYKWQINDVLSSIGLANIKHLQSLLERIRRHADNYNKRLGNKTSPLRQSSYWLYTISIENVLRFISYMKDNGVECSRAHDRNDTKTIFREFTSSLPGVDEFDRRHVCIPVGWWLTDEDVDRISSLIETYREEKKWI